MKRTTPHQSTWTALADAMLIAAVTKHNRAHIQASKVKAPVSDTRGRNIYEFALKLYWQLYNRTKTGVILQRYEEYNLSNTNSIVRNMIQSCPNSMDFRWLLAARGGLLHTVSQLTRFKIIQENIDFVINRNGMCPWCSANVREDPSHIVLHCDKFQQFRGPLRPVLDDMVWEAAKIIPNTGATAVLKNQTLVQNELLYPRPDSTKEILFYVAIGGTWKDKKVFTVQDQNGHQQTLFWIMRCRNFLSKTPAVTSHYITVQKVLANMYRLRNSLLDKFFTVQEKSKRTCWLFHFYHSEPTPIGRARISEDEEDSSLEGASVVRLDPG